MQFRVGTSTYDKDGLPSLGSGSYGDVVDLGASYAAKIYYDRPSSDQLSKLLRLFDIGAALAIDPEIDSTIAMPVQPAIDTSDGLVAGFAMKCFRDWLRLSQLTFDPAKDRFKEAAGFSFNDTTAVQAVFTLFKLLAALARRHIAIGDISAANILVNPKSATPGLIDMDSVHVEDWESESLGTIGYVDPNLLDSDRNASGGLHFNAKSDVFAMTVIGFSLTVGMMPFYFGVHPPLANVEEFTRKRLSSLRVIVEGTAFLDRLGFKLASPDDIKYVQARLAALRAVRGQSGRDGEILYEHFVDVLVHGGRQNLIERLPDEDARNPAYETIRRLRGLVAIRELEEKFGARQAKSAPLAVLPKGLARSQAGKPFVPRDPKAFHLFLAARGIDTRALVS